METKLVINDLNGDAVEVTDLNLALMQADDYRHYRLSGKRFMDLQAKQQAYWEDLHQKLLKLAESQP